MKGTGNIERRAGLLAMLGLLLLISGCGGGGGSDDPPPIENPPQTLVWDEVNWDQGNWQ